MIEKNDIKISVVVPIYNAEKKLKECIESLIIQSLNEMEIILVNDGSTDKSEEICKTYSERIHNIKYYFQKNQGVSSARNLGIEHAAGQYIMFCDSDDYYEQDALELLYRAAENGKYDWVVGGVEKKIYGQKEVINSGDVCCDDSVTKCELLLKMTQNFMIKQLWGKLYKREIIQKNFIAMRTDMSCGEDFEWICRYITYTKYVRSISDIVYNYIVDDVHSLSQRFNRHYFKNIENQFWSIKQLYIAENMWDVYGGIIRKQQAQNIISGYFKVTKKDCNLTRQEKKNYIQEGLLLGSRGECVNVLGKGMKRFFFKLNNPSIILNICGILGSMRRIKSGITNIYKQV